MSVQVLLCINKNSLDDLLLKLYIKYVTSAVQIIIFALLFVSFLCGQYAIMWNCKKMLDYFWAQNIPKSTKHCVDFLWRLCFLFIVWTLARNFSLASRHWI